MCTYRPAYRVQVSGLKPYINRIIDDPRQNLICSVVLLEEDEEKFLRLVDITRTVAHCIPLNCMRPKNTITNFFMDILKQSLAPEVFSVKKKLHKSTKDPDRLKTEQKLSE